MTGQLPELRVRPADAYAALRVIQDAASAAAKVILDESVIPAADKVGATTFLTPFGKVYATTSPAHIEIKESADLVAWARVNLDGVEGKPDPLIPEHDEDQFTPWQLGQAAIVLVKRVGRKAVTALDEDLARDILRASFPPRKIPEQLAGWVIPFLLERAEIIEEDTIVNEDGTKCERSYVVDSVTGEEWEWATAVPEHVGWAARLSKDAKADTANLILQQVNDFAGLVGVKEIGR